MVILLKMFTHDNKLEYYMVAAAQNTYFQLHYV